ncbi:Cysteine/Histidine-rich C1 domain family protein [Striga hermonthica]|uniref:Cysteine/Histidine-rich C1 domain family protein n=1 Tax=Striga hermonthica TaxID=68872 RepID=A0A9N7RAG3_STRHE|nr:Cysteine/Histidine-rich C1 domain family protein [Striga hermonthica]
MEFKHFSHPHNLSLHHGPETRCSGCKSARPGPFYACFQCNYFLDEHCFRAARALNHPAHPTHPLTLVSSPTYQSASFFCNDCSLLGTGFCYACSDCDFDVHVHCAHKAAGMPNPCGPHVTSVVVVSGSSGPNDHHHHRPVQYNPVYPPPVNRDYLFPN